MNDKTALPSTPQDDEPSLTLGYIPKGTLVKVNGFPFRLIEAANIESHAYNFESVARHDAMVGATPQVVAGRLITRPVAQSESTARKWLVWEVRRKVYWQANQAGYTEDKREAGQYSDGEALAIVERMNYTPHGDSQVKLVPANDQWLPESAK